MNDPWDVKSVRQLGQYVSCMKLNGVPLLPPVLSKECRKEMQYYKLLAREVEKRMTLLQPYIEICNDSTTSTEDTTDAPELPESEQIYEINPEVDQAELNFNINMVTADTSQKTLNKSLPESTQNKLYSCITSNLPYLDKAEDTQSPKFIIDLSLSINESGRNTLDPLKTSKISHIDLPERDYDCLKQQDKNEILMNTETPRRHEWRDVKGDYNYKVDENILSDSFSGVTHDGPSSLSCKSFTGSLNDLNIESARESHVVPNLVRQSSYTLLKPSPQLLAHLEVQSLNAGVEINSISMSELLSNLSTPSKKRRSWDLETAKVKWSNMALELKQKNLLNGVKKEQATRPASQKIPQASPPISRPVVPDKPRRGSVTSKTVSKSEPAQKTKSLSPVRKISTRTPISPKLVNEKTETSQPTPHLINETEDPAARVRELYEKIQKQQLIQMGSLVEKQKKEQLLLQQVFEEQNNMLYKQLKTICPKSPIEIKKAWEDHENSDRGPVSLSQLINQKSPDLSIYDSPVSTTLIDTNNCINHCDNMLKKSRDLSGNIKKQQQPKSRNKNGCKIQAPKSIGEGSRTRTHSPSERCTPISRKLNYDTSASSEREYDPILTDRTNDTMADLNFTFPSDHTDDYLPSNLGKKINHLCGEEVTVIHKSPVQNAVHNRSIESAIRHKERFLPSSKSVRNDKPKMLCNPTPQQREAANKIVAHAKGFLVRRLMKTERVQGTVQTIKDALLCALQLHQDREGIRGADVDLHRRLIQQITAACYSLHDTFIGSTPADRCAMIAADRGRRRSLAARQPTPKPFRQTDVMSQSHSGIFPSRGKRPSPASLMTQSNYETFSRDKCSAVSRSRLMASPRRRPWR